MFKQKKKLDLTEGSIVKSLMLLSGPIIFANVLQTIYQIIDTFWVGRLGTGAIAAVSLSFPVLFFLTSVGMGMSIAGTVLVSQYFGSKNQRQVNYVSSQIMILMFFISIILSVIGYLLSGPLIHLIGAAPEIFPDAVAYLKYSFVGLVFMFVYFVFQSLFRGIGEVKIPMLVVLGTVILNFILDPIFILGKFGLPAFGVEGAALVTVVTEGVAAIIGLIILFEGRRGIKISRQDFKLDWPLWKRIIKLGLPLSIGQSSRALGMLLMTFLVAYFGTLVVAIYGLGSRILSFIIIPALGFSIAASTMVGQNIGAGKRERVYKIAGQGSLFSFLVLTVIGITVFIFAKPIISAFAPGEAELIKQSVLFIRIMSPFFGLIGLQMILMGVFQGSGDSVTSMNISLTSLVVSVGLAFVLSRLSPLGITGIWWSYPATNFVLTIVSFIHFRRERWKKKSII